MVMMGNLLLISLSYCINSFTISITLTNDNWYIKSNCIKLFYKLRALELLIISDNDFQPKSTLLSLCFALNYFEI